MYFALLHPIFYPHGLIDICASSAGSLHQLQTGLSHTEQDVRLFAILVKSVLLFTLAGMDVYGYLMAREGHLEDVEVLGGRLFNISDQHAEPWVISG